MKKSLILFFPLLLWSKSYDLKTLITHAAEHNPQMIAKAHRIDSKSKEVEAQESSYWPTLDMGASYTHTTPKTIATPGSTTLGYAKVSMDIYDGGRKKALLQAKRFTHRASLLEKDAFGKSITLKIIQHYYTMKKLDAMLFAMQKESEELLVQIHRLEKFLKAGLATSEEIDKLQAVYDENQYKIEEYRLLLETSREQLTLLTGLSVKVLKKSYLKEPKKMAFRPYEESDILEMNQKALEAKAKAIDAGYRPQVQIEDSYTQLHYSETETIPGLDGDAFFPDHQNKLMLSVNMRLFDKGKMKKEREAVQYEKLALASEKEYALSRQKMYFRLAKKRLHSIRSKLKSAKSALHASQSTYGVIMKKFETGLADNIAYLDALNNVTLSKARYKETMYEYEIAKSIYYYYAGRDPKEYIR